MYVDAWVKWKEHVETETVQLKLKYKNIYWLLGSNFHFSVINKVLLNPDTANSHLSICTEAQHARSCSVRVRQSYNTEYIRRMLYFVDVLL